MENNCKQDGWKTVFTALTPPTHKLPTSIILPGGCLGHPPPRQKHVDTM